LCSQFQRYCAQDARTIPPEELESMIDHASNVLPTK
jgi:hypothetical protein